MDLEKIKYFINEGSLLINLGHYFGLTDDLIKKN